MNVFSLNITKEIFNDSTGETEFKIEEVKFSAPSEAEEITLRQWVNWQLKRLSAPTWFKEVEAMDGEEKEKKVLEWLPDKWLEYVTHLSKEISCFTSVNFEDLIKGTSMDDNSSSGLLALYQTVLRPIAEYKPKERQSFTHKGVTFAVPASTVDSFNRKMFGEKLSTLEAIEALQVEHVYSAKDENGEFIVEDYKYHNDLALVAVLCRKVNPDKSLEKIPLDFVKRRVWRDNRIKFLEDVSFTVAQDIDFFLRNSKRKCVNIRTSRLFSRAKTSAAQRRRRGKRKVRKSGSFGDGTTS